ncbi:hypothetical protein ABZ249_02860 [Nocardiopsis sp. NPDC006139]|uniref:hypothetical protein n=1 Tax=unclassified Nocardiopsis TaxID=2649073 RepID=UPI0033A16B78
MADPVTIALATAVVTGMASKISERAGEAVGEGLKRLRRAVFKRFRGDEAAQDALDEAMLDTDDPAAVEAVAEHLERIAAQDPEIGALVRELGAQVEVGQEGEGNVVNQIHGDVSGRARVVQGRDFHGDIHL